MATLTIADLDNGKRDLQTVSEVANSRAATATTRFGAQTTTLYEAIRRIGERGDAILRNLGFEVPVPYAEGLEVTEPNFTVTGPDGKLYAAQPGQVPFTTGAWDDSQWYPIQNVLNDKKLLVFDSLVEAESSATTLPDGQIVVALDANAMYTVSGGALDFEKSVAQLASPLDYQAKGDGATNDDAAFSALESAVVGEVVDLLGREYLVSVVPSGNDYINGSFSIGRSKEDRRVVPSNSVVQPMRAYRRKPISFPPVNAYTDAILADGGQYFPNSMVIDDQEDEVFFITNSPWWVQVYDFHTREIKTVFKLSTGGSEGASIYRKDGRRYLVRRGQTQFMEMFDITDLPAPMSTVTPASTSTFKVGTNFAVRGDYLYTTMHGRAKGNNIYQRNIIDVIDLRTNARVSRLILDPAKTGFSNQQITTFPKMQGFDVMGGYLLLANGSGGYNHTTDTAVNPSRMQGFRVLASDGSTVAECFFDPKSMGDKLLSLGYRYQYQECEGVQFAYGRIYSMFAIAGKEGAGADQEGWMLFEEMSEAPDAIDFSDCAAFVPSSTQRFYSSTYPRDVDAADTTQTFTSMYDGSQITSVAGFFEMMYQLQMDSLTISTRGTALANGLGANLASSGILRLYNQDNEYFLAELINYTGNTAGYNVYAVRTGENAYTFTRNNPDYWDGSLVPREVGTQDLGAGVRVWNNVFGNRFGPSSTRMIQWGSGNPNGVVAASYGAVFFNTSGGAGETMWVKETGGGTDTGWVAK